MPTLKELIAEAQRTAGFAYYSTESTSGGKGYQILSKKRFKIGDNHIIGVAISPTFQLETPLHEGKFPFNEAVIYGEATMHKQTGEKRVGVFRKKKPVYDFAPVNTGEVLQNGNQDPASSLTYLALRVESDGGSRSDPVIHQGLVASTSLVNMIAEELKKHPDQAGAIFQGVFPELEQKYHVSSNGKILIASKEVAQGKDLGDHIYNYGR